MFKRLYERKKCLRLVITKSEKERINFHVNRENKANVRRWTEEGWNQRNLVVFDELAASNWVYHDPGLPKIRTLAHYKRWVSETHNAFPDYYVTIEDMIAEGYKVVVRYTFHGTNTGELVTPMPLPATGKQVMA